uniref:EGF-like domain-containing protein n=1 Tax=Anopheles stephensi TaxID=30069 RepID=A0A182Y1I8_ANOST
MAHCIAPNVCQCHEGHEKNDTHLCIPACKSTVVDCTMGSCVGVNVCECDEGYTLEMGEDGCSTLPDNAECIAPDEHRCLEGYQPMYDQELLQDRCVPSCEQECENGTCTAPNQCTCIEGFSAGYNETCSSICEKDCEGHSGVCVENLCQCFDGYSNLVNAYLCSPVCAGCEHGECLMPDECSCFDGYEMNNQTASCEPVCDNCTGDTYCKSPGQCACYGEGAMITDEQNNVHCILLAESFQQADDSLVWLAIVGTISGLTVLFAVAYVMYKRSTGSFNTAVRMSEIKVID